MALFKGMVGGYASNYIINANASAVLNKCQAPSLNKFAHPNEKMSTAEAHKSS
jgi:hypothetical protein